MTDVEPVQCVPGTAVPIQGNDIDTDQIIPARFLKVVTFEGLGQYVFFDQRFDRRDNQKDHPFNKEHYQDASILVVNANFGCGSSREHAPQALMRWGIDAIIGQSFAEIFASNCLALGIPTVTTDQKTIRTLQNYIEEHPNREVTVDMETEAVSYEQQTISVTVEEAHRKALTKGTWDTTALLQSNEKAIKERVKALPYIELNN
jgi:3-isopropylmalate/(R)-2-methylmalate dehydratase small subunit